MFSPARYWLVFLIVSLVWRFLASPAQSGIQLLLNSEGPTNVLLLTAHPDDECMFFVPTILGLQDTPLQYPPTLHSLCLSVGNADGLGNTRRRELEGSLDVLGIDEGRRWVIDKPELQDNFTAEWDPEVIADTLRPYVLENRIDTILTFDHHGVSSHPNHISLPKGAAQLLRTLPGQSRPRLFALVTVPLREKYLGALSPLLAKALARFPRHAGVRVTQNDDNGGGGSSSTGRVVAVAGVEGYARAHRAMRQHWSQLVWFRWLYVSFSRYMWVNEWVEVSPPSDA